MAVNSFNKKLNALLTSTMENYEETLADNVFRSNVTLAKMKEKGQITEQDGGSRIVQPLLYGRNKTIQSYNGYDRFKVEPSDGISAAVYEWRQVGGTITISRKENRMNSGKAQLFNLLEKKIMQAEMTLQENVNGQLINAFEPGNSGKDLTPLNMIVSADPTSGAAANLGGISTAPTAGNDFWKNQVLTSSATTASELKWEFYRLYNLCSRGGMNKRPDLALTDQITFELYEASLDAQQRYVDESTADLGFENLKLKGATLAWEEVMPDVQNQQKFEIDDEFDGSSNPATGSLMMMTTEFLELVVDSQTRFKTTEFKDATDQDASIAKLLFMGNMTCSNRRKQGVLKDINRDLTL